MNLQNDLSNKVGNGGENWANVSDVGTLRSEIDRLNQVILQLTKERDACLRAAQAYAATKVSQEDIQRYLLDEPGLPLEAFIGELEGASLDGRGD